MADLVPHELLVEVANTRGEKLKEKLKDKTKADALTQAVRAAKAAEAVAEATAKSAADAAAEEAVARAGEKAGVVQAAEVGNAAQLATAAKEAEAEAAKTANTAAAAVSKAFDELVKELAASGWLPDMVTFTGYAAEKVKGPVGGAEWQLLYTDLPLVKWLLVEKEGIVYSTTVEDDASPFKKRDVLWVDEDASVGMGMGSQSVEARFLTGTFTRAGDFGAPPGGGTIAASTGVFCEANTVGCCTKKSTN